MSTLHMTGDHAAVALGLVFVVVGLIIALRIGELRTEPQHARCADFRTQAQAQAAFLRDRNGYRQLDGDLDGIACEALP